MTENDTENIFILQPEGWSDITYYFRFYIKHPFCFPIIAFLDNDIAGVACGIENYHTGWISHVIVSENFRNRGIGTKLTRTVSRNLAKRGCVTQSLIATEEGERIYHKLGFRQQNRYLFYKSKKLNIKPDLSYIRKLNENDYEEISGLDRDITGESRMPVLQYFLSQGWVSYNKFSGQITGIYLPGMGEGHVIARDKEAGLQFLMMKHFRKENTTVIPEENLTACKFLELNDFQYHKSAPRMVLGPEIRWKPENVFSRAGGFYG